MINRSLRPIVQEALSKLKKSVLLMGPRQVGKSTLIDSLNPVLKINLAEQKTYLDHLKDPGLILRQARALDSGIVFVDEIQRLPSLLNSVQALVDESKTRTFILTGSSARKLRRGQVNLLPGRLFTYQLLPLSFWELGEKFNLDRVLHLGSLPEVYLHDYGPQLLENYIDAYLREEIQAEAAVRNLDSFSRFVDLAAAASGQIINYSKLASDSEIPKESIRRYFDILSDTLLVHKIPGYSQIKGSRKPMQKERILFFDIGVRNAILGIHRNTLTDVESGALFEQWIIQQLILWSSYSQKHWKFFYYRDDLNNEVDLVIDLGDKLAAIEIKYSRKLKKDAAVGLNFFSKIVKKPVISFILFRGDHAERWENLRAIPYGSFLETIDRYLR